MRHLKDGRKFDMNTAQRVAMFRNMVTSLLQYEKITTTLHRAKELRRVAEKTITLGKSGTAGCRRKALGFVRSEDVVTKVFGPLAERYKARKGGYTRVFKAGFRNGDGAAMAIIELVDRDVAAEPKRRTKRVEKEEAAKA